ncbi:hypothetical protein GCM10022243_34350 [Saccharothrix violaceirubra]|uniref:Uncharacterized protein n=1 Tax=Saccharothrix violaceirubra TaxID=413306 RepID=A0A7W7T4P6_9PSEU|nr:hypothetical protein [Saccharothrix violaceirubra]MBB4966486.1 hypothetical protein [Saccharothrix violaceirubra]
MSQTRFTMIKVGFTTKVREWWHGRRDGRRGIPAVVEGRPLPHTPHERTLSGRRDEVVDRTFEDFTLLVRPVVADVERCYRRLASLAELLAARKHRLSEQDIPLSVPELDRRGQGEDVLPAETVRTRNRTDQLKRVGPMRAAVEETRSRIAAELELLARLEAEVTAALRAAQSKALQYCAYTDALRGHYWRSLARVHPDREDIAGRWHLVLPRAPWLTEGAYRAALGLGVPGGPQAG